MLPTTWNRSRDGVKAMGDWKTIQELVSERDAWIEKYGIGWWGQEGDNKTYVIDEMTQADRKLVEELDKKKLVWTNHTTCDGERFTAGMHTYENSCCWVSHAFYIANKPWEEEYETVFSTSRLPCPVCNADGEGDGDEDCEGPTELPATDYGVDIDEGCEEGWIQVFMD